MIVSRRVFLSLAALVGDQGVSQSLPFFDSPSHNASSISPEFLKIYQYWMQVENIEPDHYLENLGCSNVCGDQLCDFIVDDFNHDRILVYNGVIASRTEVAICALYGKFTLT
jgi:hypothetical protein